MAAVLIGDSQAQGLKPMLTRLMPGLRVEARPGWSEARWASVVADVVGGADTVIFQLGGNNRRSGERYAQDVDALLRAAKGARVLWIGPTRALQGEVATWHERTAGMQRALLAARGVPWFDSRTVTQTGQRSDGVHFTPAGYARWGEALASWVKSSSNSSRSVLAGLGVTAAAALAAVLLLRQGRAR